MVSADHQNISPLFCFIVARNVYVWAAVLKDQVCSPGGTTIAAVEALEKNGFRAAAISAVVAAASKSIEMRDVKT